MRQAQERLGSELESRLSRQTSISALRLPSLAPVLPGCGGICNLRAVGCPPCAHSEGLWEPSCADNGLSGGGREAEDGGRKTGDGRQKANAIWENLFSRSRNCAFIKWRATSTFRSFWRQRRGLERKSMHSWTRSADLLEPSGQTWPRAGRNGDILPISSASLPTRTGSCRRQCTGLGEPRRAATCHHRRRRRLRCYARK